VGLGTADQGWGIDPSGCTRPTLRATPSEGLEPDVRSRDLWLQDPARRARASRQQEGQLLGDGRHRSLRAVQRDPHRPHARQERRRPWSTPTTHRVMEIWNLVFIQFNPQPGWQAEPVAGQARRHRHGLSSASAPCCRARPATTTPTCSPRSSRRFPTSAARPLHAYCCPATTRRCGEARDHASISSYRVIADHVRCLTFALTDGAVPDQGRPGLCAAADLAAWRALWLAVFRLARAVPAQARANRGRRRWAWPFPELKQESGKT
jgi:alanyl-tRNA synthetase